MVISVSGRAVSWRSCAGPCELFEAHPALEDGAKELVKEKAISLRPDGVLYARQKEFVVSHRGDRFSSSSSEILYLGTDDVLTCHVLVLHHPFTHTFALAHFDEYVREPGLNRFLSAFLARVRQRYYVDDDDYYNGQDLENNNGNNNNACEEDEDYEYVDVSEDEEEDENFDIDGPIIFHIVGGYSDTAGKAAKLSRKILRFFHGIGQENPDETGDLEQLDLAKFRADQVFELKTCCIGLPNSKSGMFYHANEPIIGGVALEMRTGKVSPAKFNRALVTEDGGKTKMDEEIMQMLMLGPLLKPRPERLKKMVKQLEDRGYSEQNQECRSILKLKKTRRKKYFKRKEEPKAAAATTTTSNTCAN